MAWTGSVAEPARDPGIAVLHIVDRRGNDRLQFFPVRNCA